MANKNNGVDFSQNCNKVLWTKDEVLCLKSSIPKDKKVILTTGCFDLFHANHANFLRKAKEEGDILVIALNSDRSVKLLKGEKRPIVTLDERLTILNEIRSVDFIVVFEERKPDWVVEALEPDMLIKGDDYEVERLQKSYPSVNEIKTVEQKHKNINTTLLISRILERFKE